MDCVIPDIPLLPSISSLSGSDDEESGGPFNVHWLNNKELHLTLTMEVFLQQLRSSLELPNQPQDSQADDGIFWLHLKLLKAFGIIVPI